MHSLYAYLNGGLGNQMFQYATARALALDHQAELFIDPWSGFVRDYQYRRHYELGALPVQAHVAALWQRLPIWLYRLQHRAGRDRAALLEQRWFGKFITETEFAYLPQVNKLPIGRTTWLVGYWQSPCYFEHHAHLLRVELMPPAPRQPRYLEMGEQLRQTESVALGVRLYEESINPSAHAHEGRVKTAAEISAAVARMKTRYPSVRFYVFCTHRSPLLAQLNLSEDTVFVTHDDGYLGTIESLWLLSQCRHHIITNSSYYWWGAWLSAAHWASTDQFILAADNFVNRDAVCDGWETF